MTLEPANLDSADLVFDGDPAASWIEGKTDDGVGEFIEITLRQSITADLQELSRGLKAILCISDLT